MQNVKELTKVNDIQQALTEYIGRELLFGEMHRMPGTNDPLLGTGGVVDSVGLNQLIAFVESRFGFRVDDLDIVPENFGTLAALTTYVQSHRPG